MDAPIPRLTNEEEPLIPYVDKKDYPVSRTRFPWTQNWLNRSVQGGPEHDR